MKRSKDTSSLSTRLTVCTMQPSIWLRSPSGLMMKSLGGTAIPEFQH
jgi:hypothetical protein